jgi:hypothetical protein
VKLKIFIILLMQIFALKANCQKLTYSDLKKGVSDLDGFTEYLTEKGFILSEKKVGEDYTSYNMALKRDYDTYDKSTSFWIYVIKHSNSNVIELQFNDKHKPIYTNLSAFLKQNCKKISFEEDINCKCFVAKYSCGQITLKYFEKEHKGEFSYHILAEKQTK